MLPEQQLITDYNITPFCSSHQLSKDSSLNIPKMIIAKQKNASKTQENRETLTGLTNKHKIM